jgi:hypothetical protein
MNACDTCAFRDGSVIHDQEPYNALRGLICALGARPFYCHHLNGEDHHGDQQYLLQRLPSARRFLQKVYAGLGKADSPILQGETLRICEGWKEEVRRHKAAGLFSDPAVREVRRLAAARALQVIEDFIAAPEGSKQKAGLNWELGSLIGLLAEPAEAERV